MGHDLFIKNDVVLEGNNAYNGGGIFITAKGAAGHINLQLSGNVAVRNNTAKANDGGIYATHPNFITNDTIALKDKVSITGNKAVMTFGGGIWVDGSSVAELKSITAEAGVTFSGNRAKASYPILDDAWKELHAQNIKTTGGFSNGHEYAYNNHDIRYTVGEVYYNVNFMYNLDVFDTEVYLVQPSPNQKLVQPPPPIPNQPGYIFTGKWYKDAACTKEWDFAKDKVFFDDETLYAGWTRATLNVTYDANGGTGSQQDANTYNYNAPVTILDEGSMQKPGHHFTGWNTQADGGGTAYAAGEVINITDNLHLYAQYTPNSHTVTFVYGVQGMENQQQAVNYGELVPPPTPPVQAAYHFTGWYTDEGALWNFDTEKMVDADLTLTARWAKKAFTVHYISQGREFATREVTWGELVPTLNAPTVDGHTFAYWCIDGDHNSVWDMLQGLMPQGDLILEAVYNKNAPPPASSQTPASSSPSAGTSSQPSASSSGNKPGGASQTSKAQSGAFAQTGDSAPILLWVVVMMAGLGGMAVAIVLRKRAKGR